MSSRNQPLWHAANGAEFTLGDAVRVSGVRLAEFAVTGMALVVGVTGHDGRPVVVMLSGSHRTRSTAVWPRDVLEVVRNEWQARNGDQLRVGDRAALAILDHGPNPVGRIVNIGAMGNPIVWVVSDRLLNGSEMHLEATDFLQKVPTMTDDKPVRRPPMYLEVAAVLREAITSGRYAPGDRLPSETQLMRRHHVSRVVAKAAMNILKHDGLADGRQGSGIYVRHNSRLTREVHNLPPALPAPGWLDAECFGGGILDPSTNRQEKIEANVPIAQRLAIAPGTPLIQASGRYLQSDGRPLQLVTSWQVHDQPGSDAPGRYQPDHREERIIWRAASPQEIDTLDLPWQGSVLAITHTLSRRGIPLATADIIIPSDRCELVYQTPTTA